MMVAIPTSSPKRQKKEAVLLHFPPGDLARLDREAARRGLSRAALVRSWVQEGLEEDTEPPVCSLEETIEQVVRESGTVIPSLSQWPDIRAHIMDAIQARAEKALGAPENPPGSAPKLTAIAHMARVRLRAEIAERMQQTLRAQEEVDG